jgi:hypothetical protein
MLGIDAFRLARLDGWGWMNAKGRRQVYRFLEQYLGKRGWAKSVADGGAVDLDGAIPWYTYPAITEIARVLPASAKVFEYGSGNSTLWWRAHADEVVSVEHDADWHAHANTGSGADIRLRDAGDQTNEAYFDPIREIAKPVPAPPASLDAATITRRGLTSEPFLSYVAELMTFPEGYFDVIVVDGMARSACARLASDRLKPGGFIVFDNSDREEYADAYRFLIDAGFARMDYWGPGPINAYEWCTSIFTKSLGVFQR